MSEGTEAFEEKVFRTFFGLPNRPMESLGSDGFYTPRTESGVRRKSRQHRLRSSAVTHSDR